MKKFDFKLQKLLDIREAAEKKVKNELAGLLNRQNAVKLRQQNFRNKIIVERENFGKKMRDKQIAYQDILMFERFLDSTTKAINIAEHEIQGMESGIQKVREKLIEASREKKVVEKLKEKQWKQYMYELNRETNKENDDMNQKIYQIHKRLTAVT
jgi:flagellar FliJ protein